MCLSAWAVCEFCLSRKFRVVYSFGFCYNKKECMVNIPDSMGNREGLSEMALIVIEGLDGSGKGTQSALLETYAQARGGVRKITFPDYDSPSSALVKMYLAGDFGTEAGAVNAYAASMFYAVDRFASFQTQWKEDYHAGKTIIADRYVTANMVYQLSKLPETEWEDFLFWLEDLEYGKLGLPRPDRVLYLDVPPHVSQQLLQSRYGGDLSKKDIHEKDLKYLLHCRECALFAAKKLNWKVLNCADENGLRSIEDIHNEIVHELEDLL